MEGVREGVREGGREGGSKGGRERKRRTLKPIKNCFKEGKGMRKSNREGECDQSTLQGRMKYPVKTFVQIIHTNYIYNTYMYMKTGDKATPARQQ
jgi:hypothetical protein